MRYDGKAVGLGMALVFVVGLVGLDVPVLAQAPSLAILEERAFQQAALKCEPSIVRIETIGGQDVIGEMVVANGPTTGVVVGADGWIITSSFNFVSQPTSILVTTSDGKRHPATLIAKDESRQLTLLKIAAEGLKTLDAVPVDEVRVGQWAIALGRTMDPAFPNVSVGIISAVNRISGKAVQTDAKVSPTNYGGALVDIDGRCLGIIVPMSGDQQDEVTAGVSLYDSGIGFAVPLAEIRIVLRRMQNGETLKAGKLGILFTDKGLLGGEVKIDKVRPRSPAEAAGLKAEDVIVGVDGKDVARTAMMRQLLGPRYAGETVTLKVRRGSETFEKPITLVGEIAPFELGYLGVLPERTKKGEKSPVKVRAVVPKSPADEAGLKPGAVITKVGSTATPTAAEFRAAMKKQAAGDKVTLEISTGGLSENGEITLASQPTAVPADVPPQDIPAGPAVEKDAPKVGRFVDTIEGDPRKFWAYVPEHYNPDFAYGLAVWLHPSDDKREASTLKIWKSVCDERGIILVAPPAAGDSWGPGDFDFITGVIAKMQDRYTIDPQRTVLVGEATGARVALFLGLRQRDKISGMALIGTALPATVPETDPENAIRLHISTFESSPLTSKMKRGLEGFQKQKYPLIFQTWKGDGKDGPTEETAAELGRWIDQLDGV